jgi:hypothetical protein
MRRQGEYGGGFDPGNRANAGDCSVRLTRSGTWLPAVARLLMALAVVVALRPVVVRAEPVEIRQGTEIGAGYTFRHGEECLAVTARHVVPSPVSDVTVLDRSGTSATGRRVYDNTSYDLALVSLPKGSTIACSDTWPDVDWLKQAKFTAHSEFEAVRHYPNGRETLVLLRYAGGTNETLTLAPTDKLTIRESDSGTAVRADGRLAGIVQRVETATDRVEVLRFDVMDQLVGQRFTGSEAGGAVSLSPVLWGKRPNPTWTTYIQSWLTEQAGRNVVPTGNSAAHCDIQVEVLSWDRVAMDNPQYATVQQQLAMCSKNGWLWQQMCEAGKAARPTTPAKLQGQKIMLNVVMTRRDGTAATKLETSTHVLDPSAQLTVPEIQLAVLQKAFADIATGMFAGGACP